MNLFSTFRNLTVHASSAPVVEVKATVEAASTFREAGQRIQGLQAGCQPIHPHF